MEAIKKSSAGQNCPLLLKSIRRSAGQNCPLLLKSIRRSAGQNCPYGQKSPITIILGSGIV